MTDAAVSADLMIDKRTIRLLHAVLDEAALSDYAETLRRQFHRNGLSEAVAQRNTPALFDWLVEVFAYQGISDSIAWAYMEQHGRANWHDIHAGLQAKPTCPKLQSWWRFEGCGYRKGAGSCGNPADLPCCPLPAHPLRNGNLNQNAYALYLFFRDVCGGDFVGWLDRQLERADPGAAHIDRADRLAEAILGPLSHIHSVSRKVLSMALADFMLAVDPQRERWIAASAGMVAIDTLVHNFLHRTGVLERHAAEHAYGPACYGPRGCAAIIKQAALDIDAREYGASNPKFFPRFVQLAIWRFCAADELDICNGNRIDDRARCENLDCPVAGQCDRIALKPSIGQDRTGREQRRT